ncbi:MAG: hypothetical protein ACRCXC_05795 [Legionella sp.]
MIVTESQLMHLNVQSNKIRDQGVPLIAQALKANTNLKHFNISDNEISEAGAFPLLHAAEAHDKLQDLILKHNHPIDSVMKINGPDLQVV